MSETTKDVLGGLAAIVLGATAFLILITWSVLIADNIGWLDFADRARNAAYYALVEVGRPRQRQALPALYMG